MTDRALLTSAVHDAETVLLPPGGSPVLPLYDLPGSSDSASMIDREFSE